MEKLEFSLADESETVAFGRKLAQLFAGLQDCGVMVYLHGGLGAGKTTLTRGVVHGLGYSGKVKSPTYTLVEPYEGLEKAIYHFDLYRLADPEELAFLGVEDYFQAASVCVVEWPQKALGFLPKADLEIELVYDDVKRRLFLVASSDFGQQLLQQLPLLANE